MTLWSVENTYLRQKPRSSWWASCVAVCEVACAVGCMFNYFAANSGPLIQLILLSHAKSALVNLTFFEVSICGKGLRVDNPLTPRFSEVPSSLDLGPTVLTVFIAPGYLILSKAISARSKGK